jgi:hypothetical protein
MRRSLVVFVFGVMAAACSSDSTGNAAPTESNPDSGPAHPFALLPYGIDPGVTHADRSGAERFSYDYVKGSPAAWTSTFEAAASYRCKAGAVSSVGVSYAESNGSAPPLYQFVAPTELPADDWCWLLIHQDSSFEVGLDGAPGEIWFTDFFTGSALHVRKLKTSSKNPNLLGVVFSEEMDAAQLIGTSFVTTQGASEICIVRGPDCAPAGEPFVTKAVDVRMSAPAGSADVTVTLPGGALGSGRDVASGAAARGVPLTDGNLVLVVGPDDWTDCPEDGPGPSSCWISSNPPPTG